MVDDNKTVNKLNVLMRLLVVAEDERKVQAQEKSLEKFRSREEVTRG